MSFWGELMTKQCVQQAKLHATKMTHPTNYSTKPFDQKRIFQIYIFSHFPGRSQWGLDSLWYHFPLNSVAKQQDMYALSQPHGFMSHHLVLNKARQLCLLVRIGLIAEIEDYHKTFSIIPLEVSSWRKVIKPDATTCTNAPSISKTVQENVPIKGKTKAASEILKVVITFLHLLHNTNPRWISFSPV